MVNPVVDPQFAFMTLDWDGKIRMDCSSPYAMASLVAARDRYPISTGNDADSDRHGIVTADAGLMNPNHFLAVAIGYLYANRPDWPAAAGVGKTAVSSSMIDRVAADLGRTLVETPVGFKWFVPGLIDGSLGFGGEESAGASFLRRDGGVWSTDKDGIILALLASEILAVTGESPSQRYADLTERFGAPAYARIDVATTPEAKAKLGKLSASDVTASELAGEPIIARLTEAPGNGAPLGGLKVVTEGGWFAARPSGTEDVYKVYAESFRGPEHLARIQEEAQARGARRAGRLIARARNAMRGQRIPRTSVSRGRRGTADSLGMSARPAEALHPATTSSSEMMTAGCGRRTPRAELGAPRSGARSAAAAGPRGWPVAGAGLGQRVEGQVAVRRVLGALQVAQHLVGGRAPRAGRHPGRELGLGDLPAHADAPHADVLDVLRRRARRRAARARRTRRASPAPPTARSG